MAPETLAQLRSVRSSSTVTLAGAEPAACGALEAALARAAAVALLLHPGLRRVRACASAEGRDGAACTGGLRVAVGLLLPLGRVDGASWLSHALHEGGHCGVHYVLLRHAELLLLQAHSGLRVQLAGAVAEGLGEEGLWGSPPAMHMQLLGRRDRLHRHCALAVRCRTTLRW